MSILSPRLVVGVTIVVVLFLLVSLAQEMNRRLEIRREVQRLEEEVAQMQATTIELRNLNQYFTTTDFQERLAREKLNYQAPGEKLVLVPDEAGQLTTEGSAPAEQIRPIPEDWWRLFFVDAPDDILSPEQT